MTVAPRTELRLAIVMNGGVSLAVWMGGVAHEIALLSRASRGRLQPPSDHPDRRVYDQWAALCKKHGVTVTVDVISGTSAGGLNGALLATALARRAPLRGLRELWRTSASLAPGSLVRREALDPVDSVLDGSYFAKEVAEAFADIVEPASSDGEEEREPQVTLFVTATALGQQERIFRDGLGAEIAVPDHRQLYRFRRRLVCDYDPDSVDPGEPWEKAFTPRGDDDFAAPLGTGRLARAARASAGFPVAFEPIPSADGDVDLGPVRVRGKDNVFLMDGGVLNNAPFGPVLEEIARRPVEGPWKRVVAYVVPSGGKPDPESRRSARPDWVDAMLAAIRLPPEADLRSGLEELTARQRAADQSVETADRLLRTLLSGGDEADRLMSAAQNLMPDYRRSQVIGSILDTLTLWAADGAAPQIDAAQLSTLQPTGDRPWLPPLGTIGWSPQTWHWGTAAAERCVRLLIRAATRVENTARKDLVRAISDGVRRLEAVRDTVEGKLGELAPIEPAQYYDLVLDMIDKAVEASRVDRVCGRIVEKAATAYHDLLPEPAPDVGRIVQCCLVAEVLMHALTSRPFERPAGFEFIRLGPDVDSPVVGPIRGDDDPAPVPPGPWKLWGTQLQHFAAFGRPEWRMHDWLWGRLDASARLAAAVAAAGRSDLRGEDPAVADLHSEILLSEARGRGADATREGRRMNDATKALVDMTPLGVVEEFRKTRTGPDTAAAIVNAVLQTLRSRGRRAAVHRIGDLVSTVLAERVRPELHDDMLRERMPRLVVRLKRQRFWQHVRGQDLDDPDGGEGSGPPRP